MHKVSKSVKIDKIALAKIRSSRRRPVNIVTKHAISDHDIPIVFDVLCKTKSFKKIFNIFKNIDFN